jgi:hypothetical protein
MRQMYMTFVALNVTALMLPTAAVKADLFSPLYIKAKALQNSEQCSDRAVAVLNDYIQADRLWLASNPEIHSRIQRVIGYCTSHGFRATGVGSSAPKLP